MIRNTVFWANSVTAAFPQSAVSVFWTGMSYTNITNYAEVTTATLFCAAVELRRTVAATRARDRRRSEGSGRKVHREKHQYEKETIQSNSRRSHKHPHLLDCELFSVFGKRSFTAMGNILSLFFRQATSWSWRTDDVSNCVLNYKPKTISHRMTWKF